MKARHPIFWIAAVAVSVASLWWMLHIPRRPADLLRAIPVQAEYVGFHRDLAGRWGDVCSNATARALFGAVGIRQADLDSLARDPQARDWLNRLADDEVVLARVPNLANGQGGWVFASWLGGRSQRLRLSLQWSQAPMFESMGRAHGWPIWRAKSRLIRTGDELVFSLVEGMVVGCVARDPHAIDTVLNCIDGRYPSLYLQRDDPALKVSDQAADRGWFRVETADGGLLSAPRIRFAVDRLDAASTGARIELPWPLLAGSPASQGIPPEAFAASLSDIPAMTLWTEPATALTLLDSAESNEVTRSLRDLLATATTGTVGAAMLAGNYAGHLFGMRLPTLAVGARSSSSFDAGGWLTNTLDRLNATQRWGLVAADASVSSTRVWSITSTAMNLYASAERGEHVSLARGGDWFALLSNAGGFTNAVQDAFLRGRRQPRLLDRAKSPDTFPVVLESWIDMPEAGRSLRFALGAYTLKTLTGDEPGRREQRLRMNLIRRWLESAEALGTVRLWAGPIDGGTAIRVETLARPDTIAP